MCQMSYGSGWSVKEVFSVACVRIRRSSSVHGRLFIILEMTRQELSCRLEILEDICNGKVLGYVGSSPISPYTTANTDAHSIAAGTIV